MSDDLISRKALLKELREIMDEPRNTMFLIGIGAAVSIIEHSEIAFDKEKVIEQLNRCRVYQFQGMLPDGRVCHFSDVVEIVEKGGIG